MLDTCTCDCEVIIGLRPRWTDITVYRKYLNSGVAAPIKQPRCAHILY